MRQGLFAVALLAGIAGAATAGTAEDLARCRDIVDANERLRCYDALARTVLPPPATSPSEPPKPAPLDRDDPRAALVPTGRTGDGRSLLSQRWELDREDKYGAFQFTYYRPNYILPALWSTDVNRMPESPTRAALPLEIPYQPTEGAFQLSFKIKMAEEVFGTGSDIWIGYTQQSYWQVYNDELSRPFRETNYEPEVMWVVPTDYEIFGLRGRLLSFGLAHQSNGRTEPLSRSWNRAYAMVGLERGSFVLQAKAWTRLSESDTDDDNPDIVDYVGRAELLGYYQLPRGGSTALRLRTTFKTDPSWGSAQFDWRFPISGKLFGYLQVFSGYGESMIDYNFRKTSVGLGISIGSWY
ncbi:MAG TPA: phospholipase A [Burkholderiaceae bacterium]|nr:phospholipase A [Burkholderiaceae bacterium]